MNTLEKYKRVECAGTYLNNMENHTICKTYEQKLELLQQSKFTIACESVEQDGFVTEKVLHALYAGSVPIYFGSKSVGIDFNPESMIDYRNFDSMDSLLAYVKELDQNNEKYQKYIDANKYASADQYSTMLSDLDRFLVNIFDQEYSKAFRRPKYFQPQGHEKRLLLLNRIYKHKPEKLFHCLYKLTQKADKKNDSQI
mgnify:CR=1 FL=1